MKKALLFLAALSMMALMVAPVVLAQTGPIESCIIVKNIAYRGVNYGVGQTVDATTGDGGVVCLVNTINRIIDLIFFVLVILVGLFVIYAAFLMLTSGGDSTKVATARNLIAYALIGLVLAFLSRAIPTVVLSLLG